MKRVACYVRVSTQEQKTNGLSVDNQIQALSAFCIDNGYFNAGIFNDAGISARKRYTKRPALLNLLNEIKAGNIDLVIFTKLDRWFRSVADYYEVQSILDQNGVPWRAIWEDYDTETSAGVFKVNIMLSVAQSEADRTSERIKATMEYKRQRGDYVGSAPLGYKVVGPALVKDEATEPAMTAFFDTYLTTMSVTKGIKAAHDAGLKLEHTHIYKLLHNPVYCGHAKGNYKCEPYITEEQFALIQDTMHKQARAPKYAHRTFMFSGMVICAYCGKRMAGKAVHRTLADGTKRVHMKYSCAGSFCPHNQIVEGHLEKYLLEKLDTLLADKAVEIESHNKAITGDGAKRKSALEAKLKRLATLYTDGDLTIEDYRAKRDAIKEEMAVIVIDPLPMPVQLPQEWREIYEALDTDHRRTFWLRVIDTIVVSKDNHANLTVNFKMPP